MKNKLKKSVKRQTMEFLKFSLLTLTLSLISSTAGFAVVKKIDENTASITKADLNEIRQTIKEAEYLREALKRERAAYDELAASRAYLDAERDAEVKSLRSALRAKERKERLPHLIVFAETARSRQYESDYRLGLRLEWRLF